MVHLTLALYSLALNSLKLGPRSAFDWDRAEALFWLGLGFALAGLGLDFGSGLSWLGLVITRY